MKGQQLPEWTRQAIVACEILVHAGGEGEEEDIDDATRIAQRALKSLFEDVSAGGTQLHLTQKGHLECASTEKPDQSGS